MQFKDQIIEQEDGSRVVFTVEQQRALHDADMPVEFTSVEELAALLPKKESRSNDRPRREERAPRERREERSSRDDVTGPSQITIDPATGKYLGQIKWFNESRGFGFVARGGGEEIFFHQSDFLGTRDEISDGAWIIYDVVEGKKGMEAQEIELFEGEPPTE